jgi:hypothetical protein
MRASTKASAQLRRLQLEEIRRERGSDDDGVNSDSAALSAEEVTEDEAPAEEGEAMPKLRRVLQLVRPVETRWNSTLFMVQR